MHDDARLARLERSNRRLTIALTALTGVGAVGLLAGFTQPAQTPPPAESPFVGIAADPETRFMYRMRADGSLERISLGRGRVAGGGTPAVWKPFHVGTGPGAP